MAEPHVLSALKQKRARLAGEIAHAREVMARRTEQLAAVDTVLRLFAPDCDPDMIPPIKPASHGLFFRYRELGRICVDVMRDARRPVRLDRIVAVAIEVKGLAADTHLRKHVTDCARATLMRMALKGRVRRIIDHPDTWWELAGTGWRLSGLPAASTRTNQPTGGTPSPTP
jgi:hypothetical protein